MKKILLCFLLLCSTSAFSQPSYFGIGGSGEHRTYKVDLGRTTVGDLAFSVEQKVRIRLALEFELGPTFSEWYDFAYHTTTPYRTTREGKVGYLVSIGFRHYVNSSNNLLNRFYFSSKLYYHKDVTHYTFVPPDWYSGSIPSIDGNRVQGQLLYNLGYQVRVKQRFLIDFYAGFGLGLLETRDPVYFFENSEFKFTTSLSKSYELVGHYGLKIGFGTR